MLINLCARIDAILYPGEANVRAGFDSANEITTCTETALGLVYLARQKLAVQGVPCFRESL